MTTFFSTDDYVEPQWKGNPTHQYYFQIIKQGSVAGNILIKNKSFHLIGKLEDLCDIYIDNPTVSRKHAILQFKQGDLCPHLYDLGSTHGTRINKNNLPSRAYHRLSPYDTIKFGMSSRSYVLRCPEVEELLEQQQENRVIQGQKDFMKVIQAQNTKLSQQQMKEKYMELLENDPYMKVQQKSRKLQGSEKKQSKMQGIDWGIADQNDVYAYRNEYQFPLEPDLIRRLPGLDQLQLNKIAQFQSHFAKYQEIQSQFNELSNKQRRQFGLQENQRSKKQKLQKKLVQILEYVQKAEQWIRKNIFGQEAISEKPQYKKEKEDDIYDGDEFMDRTIADKKNNNINNTPIIRKKEDLTTVDYWQARKQLEQKIKRRQQLSKILGTSLGETEQMDEQDQLQAFMRQNKTQLDEDNAKLANQQLATLSKQISELTNMLSLKQTEIKTIQKKVKGIQQKSKDPELKKIQEKKKQIEHLNNTLKQLQQRERQRIALNQQSVEIFKYYEKEAKQEQEYQIMKRRREQYNEENQLQQPRKMTKINDPIYPKLNIQRDKKDEEKEDYYDLTKN